jgi:hypothetical protein
MRKRAAIRQMMSSITEIADALEKSPSANARV